MATTKSKSRPLLSVRTTSSPVTPHSTKEKIDQLRLGGFAMLTPPSSPPRKAGSSNDLKGDFESLEKLRSSIDSDRTLHSTVDGITICPFEVDFVRHQNDHKQMFGYGAWSNVYKGLCHTSSRTDFDVTTSPLTRVVSNPPLLVAVKCPARKDATIILRHEARILSRLCSLDLDEEYVATFHGIIDKDSALVITAHPLSLEDHIKSSARIAQASITISNMASPVIGSAAVWLDLANKLVTSLDWLHNEAQIVHGDIKPGNILLRPHRKPSYDRNAFTFQPLWIDFSSSQRNDVEAITPNSLSALTKEYTAPELLKVSVLQNPNSCATTDSDVFSLAVTLLVAATGDTLVYTGCSNMQRQVMATQGNSILNNIQSFSTRVPRHGVVSRALEKAVLKKDLGRISTKSWNQVINDLKKDNGSETASI